MNWKNRLTNYNFWISIFSAVLLILQALKIEFDIAYVNEIFTAVLGLLVVIGIISDPTRTSVKSNETGVKQQQDTQKVAEVDKEEQENPALPIEKKDETDYNDFQTNIKNVLNQISNDIKQQFKEMSETAQASNHTENYAIKTEQETHETEITEQEENSKPAAAEMENPYFDVIN